MIKQPGYFLNGYIKDGKEKVKFQHNLYLTLDKSFFWVYYNIEFIKKQ